MKAKPDPSTPRRSARGRKTWREKLAAPKDLPKVIEIAGNGKARRGGTCVIPAPREVDALMRRVPRGKLTTIDELRQTLARRHRTAMACPMTTGIFAWIAAHAADEAAAAGESDITPYWRTLKAKGELNPKYPGGIPTVAARLEAEGHAIVQKGKRFFVAGAENALAIL